MAVNGKIAEALKRIAFEHREADYHHHTYDEDMFQYELVKNGDLKSLEIGKRMFEGPTTGHLSDDPLKNYQFLFVASITLACRFCIEGGMPTEEAFNLSDLYIRQLEQYSTVDEIFVLHDVMFRDYTTRMQAIRQKKAYSRPVTRCMEYIENHLQELLTVHLLSEKLEISESYISTIFKKEIGIAVSEYIRRMRVDTAKSLLQYTDFSCLEIAEYLCFSSDCHFSQVFRKYTGQSPREYRKANYRKHWNTSQSE